MPNYNLRPNCCPTAQKGNVCMIWMPEGDPRIQYTDIKGPCWVMLKDVSIEIRSYWFVEVKFCPFCGTQLQSP